jgi:hypothetical protein
MNNTTVRHKRTTKDFDITSKLQYINKTLLMKENKCTRNSQMQQEGPRFRTYLFLQSVVLVMHFEQFSECMYQYLKFNGSSTLTQCK